MNKVHCFIIHGEIQNIFQITRFNYKYWLNKIKYLHAYSVNIAHFENMANRDWVRGTHGLQYITERTHCILAVGIAYKLVLVSVRVLCS